MLLSCTAKPDKQLCIVTLVYSDGARCEKVNEK